MKHALRKYISPCGSALFMVVSTMAALIVLVTAMYMSVLSSRQVQYATFDQEQAYVSSSTMADAVVAMITRADSSSGNASHSAAAALVDKIADYDNFAVGDTVRTTVTDLSESSGGLMDSVDVLITRLDDEKIKSVEYLIYDVAVTAEKNGVLETTHTILRTPKSQDSSQPPEITNFFTATGYLPNDVVINSGRYNSQLYFDNEFVKFGKIDGSGSSSEGLSFKCPMTCAGSLELSAEKATPVETEEPSFWVIGNNLNIIDRPYQFYLGGDATAGDIETCEKRGRLMVGGNFDCSRSPYGLLIGESNKPTDLYVLGDCTLGGDNNVVIYGNLYVNGNLIIDSSWATSGRPYSIDGKIYLNGKIICGDGVDPSNIGFLNMQVTYDENGNWIKGTEGTNEKIVKWNETNVPENGYTVKDAANMINEKIGKAVYPKWKVDVPESVVDINFCGYYINRITNGGISDTLKSKIINDLTYEGAVDAYEPCYVRTISSDCTIQHIYNYGYEWGIPTIIFDTGDAGNTLVINVIANRDSDGDGVDDSFSWRPTRREATEVDGELVWSETYNPDSNMGMINLITIGDGNLVINVGEYEVYNQDGTLNYKRSIIYEHTLQEFFGHYAWFMASGGTYDPAGKTAGDKSLPYFEIDRNSIYNAKIGTEFKLAKIAKDSIHHADECSNSCDYSEEVNMKDDDGNEYIAHKCATHGSIVKGDIEEGVCYCDGRVEKSKFAGKYTYNGEEQLPNVNIFIVSSSESADIRLSIPGKTTAMNNLYYGYIYAPYMTYIDMATGGGLKSVGGIIVSDYIMSGAYEYVFALPDQGITEVAGDGIKLDGNYVPAANRDWRVHGY